MKNSTILLLTIQGLTNWSALDLKIKINLQGIQSSVFMKVKLLVSKYKLMIELNQGLALLMTFIS